MSDSGSAMRRAGHAELKRNVAVALGTWGSPEAVLVEALWDIEQCTSSSCRTCMTACAPSPHSGTEAEADIRELRRVGMAENSEEFRAKSGEIHVQETTSS
jgi:hypothetical protein